MAQCDPDVLMADASCFVCRPEKELLAMQIVLLKDIAGNTQSVDELIASAHDFMALNEQQQRGMIAQLLCEISEV